MKSIALEEIYADPHVLGPVLAAGEPVGITQEGKSVANFIPTETRKKGPDFVPFSKINHRARMLEIWGPDAFKSTRSVRQMIDNARRERRFFGGE